MGDDDWREFFGFEEPYDQQADAIEAAVDAGERGGYLAMEGPCGTGKTMAALTAAAQLVRRTDDYERVLVVTPVKQQLQQFVADLRQMNAGLDEPLDGVALVGKRDLCPYGREDVFPRDASVHDRCEDLRESTAELVEADGEGGSFDGQDARELTELRTTDALDDPWWDPAKARDLARSARADASHTLSENPLRTDGADSPYVPVQPSAPEEFADGDPPLFCPFEADWYGRNKGSPVGFDVGDYNVVTSDDFLPAAVEYGTCPHRVQQVMLDHADVVIGNYNHLFDPQTRGLTEHLLDERTFVVVDEAHRLEERVRDLLSDRVGRHTLARARNDLRQLLTTAKQSEANRQQVSDELQSYEVTLEAVEETVDFLGDVAEWLDDRVAEYLANEGHDPNRPRDLPERDHEIPLRDPETDEPDELTRWAEEQGYTGGLWRSLADIGTAVAAILEDDGDRSAVCGAVGVTLQRWWERDHATYFREIELEHAPKDSGRAGAAWAETYTPALTTYNCMPARALRETFAGLGGGVLMSATLEPLDVFREVTGLDRLEAGAGDADARPVVERRYDLRFPEENRASFIVDATPFTARNRGDPTGENANQTREQYRYVLRTVARSPGNVLVCMPNYREAAWAGDYLADAVEKPVLVDESSSNEDTDALKRRFFRGDGKVLVTSTRGTLTEGVDYDGDKLAACAVVGVPLVNVGSPRVRAVRRAYADAFGEDHAFEYALTVPAVRRARQAIGRVIRGPEEVGVRAFVGRRYVEGARHSVFEYLGPGEREEFTRMTPEFLGDQLDLFWSEHA
ncbi:ATP-dependent DNA helicase [Halobacterium sp. CBA1126]|uniref:ATP-dependent DNA helicase n=1 Tax=Halobacterium sp. CBA1126 TaxID=2668074 RepID=UPI0012F9465F|nr:ATP-dependent DNA helicase [Halobacterium sp. CBA1126]MUV60926.1 DEAD/DEAH box helicase [Halobacterium sp. CBA1126]